MQNSPSRTAIDVGAVIAGTYRIEALIGRGGMGAVFLASHKRLPGKQVAIKILHSDLTDDETLARFKREAEIGSRLGHPNICAVHDFNVLPDGTPYLVLDYLEGESLAQRLKAGPLALDQALSFVRQIGSALAAAHREGIVHRDLKPQNIFLVPTEVEGRMIEIAKVLDFGISKIRGSDTVKTQESSLLGTPQYMAPEQATGQHSVVDERTDVFALGAIVYEMLAGHPAFQGASIPEVVFKVVYEQPVPLGTAVPSLPLAIGNAVSHAMSKAAGDRYSTVSNFVEALTGQPLTVSSRPSSIPPPVSATEVTSVPPAKRTGNDAFAQTMATGDHGESPARKARGSAPTVDTQSPGARSSTEIPRRRTPGWLIGLGLAGAVLAAVAMFLVLHDSDTHRERTVAEADKHVLEPAPPAPVKPIETPPVVPPVKGANKRIEPAPVTPVTKPVSAKQPAAQPDAGTPPADAEVASPTPPAPPTPVTPVTPVTPPAVADTEANADETTKQKLKEAEAALTATNYVQAERLANAIILGEQAGNTQKAHAHTIHGIVECVSHHNDEHAGIDLRQLDAFPKLRRRLIAACHAEGQLGGVPK